jgi:OOP family OmpA-OmpF porin
MTRRQWMWLWIWLLLFFIIFCVWNKLQTLTTNSKKEIQPTTTTIQTPKETTVAPVPVQSATQVEKRDINLKIIKEDDSIKISGVFHSKDELQKLKDEYSKISDNVIEGTIIIDENAQNSKIIDLMPTLTEDFSKFKNGYLEYTDKKFTVDGVVDDETISKNISQKIVLAGDILVDNQLTVDNKEAEAKKAKSIKDDLQAKLNHLLKIKKVEFLFAKALLSKNGKKTVDEVAKLLKEYKDIKVEIGGHTDSIGSAKNNKSLSQKRATAIKKYLISKGIDGKRLKAVGYGESRPLVKNDTKKNRQINRRVEFKIIGE